ncbi:MAG: alanine racemase [Acidimicrobiia bacterium]|nr:alanine racemase [Acidimicrobiia bacterium]
MTIRLTVRSVSWRSQVAGVAASVDGLVPVVKGNGYGFGRTTLAAIAAEFTDVVAVGTVHELEGLPDGLGQLVLTPTMVAPRSTEPILTVGSAEHIEVLRGWGGRVLVKVTSSMRRFGRGAELIERAGDAGLIVEGVSVHPPLAGSMSDHAVDITAATAGIPTDLSAWVSHLDPATYRSLPADRAHRLRLGTMLWHSDKSALHLQADVLDVRPVRAKEPAGYRMTAIPDDGHIVIVGAGTAGGVAALADGRSPFHHEQRRIALLEPPHMHVSMLFVPADESVPTIGSWVDLQRPLHMTAVDEYRWI